MISIELLKTYSFKQLSFLVKGLSSISFTTDHCSFKKDLHFSEYLAKKNYHDDTPGNEAMWVEFSGTDSFFLTKENKLGFVRESQTGIYFGKIFEDLIIN